MTQPEPARWFIFSHRNLQYALPVANVREIAPLPTLLPCHGDLPACLGNVAQRGILLPVLDPTLLSTQLGPATTLPKTVVIVTAGNATFGLGFDHFVAIVPLAETAAAAAPALVRDNPYLEAIRAFRDNVLLSLSVETIAANVGRNFGSQEILSEGDSRPTDGDRLEVREDAPIFLCARAETILLGIPIEKVLEVIEGYDVTALFKVAPCLRGLINLRGQVLACIDISLELGLTLRLLEERNQFVVLQGDGAEMALCVDKVTGIRRLRHDRIQAADAVVSGEMARYVSGVVEEADGPLFLVSVPGLFSSPPLQPFLRQEG